MAWYSDLLGVIGHAFRIGKATISTSGVTTEQTYTFPATGGTVALTTTPAPSLTTGRTIGMTGDVTWTSGAFNGTANVTGAATLAASGVTAGIYNNSATQTQSFTVDSKGRVTGTGSLTTITPAWSSISSKPTTIDGFGITGGSFSGDVTIANPGTLSFGSSIRQMLNLYSTSFGIGIQTATEYFRSSSAFAWFKGGVHSTTQYDPGTDGTLQMKLDATGYLFTLGGIVANNTTKQNNVLNSFGGSITVPTTAYNVYNVCTLNSGALSANYAFYSQRNLVYNKITNADAGSYTNSIYGIYTGVYAAQTNKDDAKATTLIGAYAIAIGNSTGSTIDSVIGNQNTVVLRDESVVTNAYGSYNYASLQAGELTASSAYGTYSRINNSGTTGTVTNGYLYYGLYDGSGGTTITNKWGLYLTGELKNYLSNDLGIGNTSPSARLHLTKTTEQLRIAYDATKYVANTVDSNGNLLIDAVGDVRIGDGTNYADFAPDGTLTLVGTATVFDDLLMEMKESLRGVLTKPDWDSTNYGFLFPQNDTSEYIVLNVQLPHRWKEGSSIYPHVHIHQNTNATPVFKINYRWTNIGAAVSGSWTTFSMNSLAVPYTSGTIHNVVKNDTGISGSGKTMSSILQIKLYRDDNVYTGDCLVVSFDIHIEIDSLGSTLEYTK